MAAVFRFDLMNLIEGDLMNIFVEGNVALISSSQVGGQRTCRYF